MPYGQSPNGLGKKNQYFHTPYGRFPQRFCWHPKGHGAVAVLYWISFGIIVSFVILNVFIGAVTGGMGEALEEFKIEDAKRLEEKIERITHHNDPK